MDEGSTEGHVILPEPGPCATCGEVAYIVRKSGERICARCYRRGQEKPRAEATAD
ncbi:MAG TPA: hypothetical protein VFM93_06870 [Candidatus Limnocylindria bacterium]|nr:hypothetical protein [Candidatus Limnocylindria bacterium]